MDILHLLPSKGQIRKHLEGRLADLPIFVYPSLDSTNTEARRLLATDPGLPYLIVAHTQTAGKGRLGRSFYSPLGSGLYMTLALDLPSNAGSRVTPAAAVAVSMAMERVCGKQVKIKWVNDLYLNEKKICGILTEALPTDQGIHVLVGIGINITTRHFPDGMRNPAGALLSEEDVPVDMSYLCAEIIQRLFWALSDHQADQLLAEYRARLMLVGRRVICSHNFATDGTPDLSSSTEGVVVGVDNEYGLILQVDATHQAVLRGGEISVTVLK